MPILSNSKHELFAQAKAQGQSADAAFVTAGYAQNRSNAARLNANELIRARVDEIQAEGAARAVEAIGITQEMVLREMAKIGFSDIRKVVRWAGHVTETGQEDEDGVPVLRAFNQVQLIDSDKIDDVTAGAISEVSQTKEGAIKVKLYDKRATLVDIGKHLGMFKDAEVNANITVNLTPSQAEY